MFAEKIYLKEYEKNINIYKPGQCYNCGIGLDAKIISHFIYEYHNHIFNIVVCFMCSNCHSIFFAVYQINDEMLEYYQDNFEPLNYHKIYKDGNIIAKFPKEIQEISKLYTEIYSQALASEDAGLDKVAGIGYRLAFERLIKDYAISIESDKSKHEQIKIMKLRDCIETYFPNQSTKDLLIKSTWIANDFSHYENLHKSFRLDDLRELISLSEHEIVSEIKKKNYINKIQPAKQ